MVVGAYPKTTTLAGPPVGLKIEPNNFPPRREDAPPRSTKEHNGRIYAQPDIYDLDSWLDTNQDESTLFPGLSIPMLQYFAENGESLPTSAAKDVAVILGRWGRMSFSSGAESGLCLAAYRRIVNFLKARGEVTTTLHTQQPHERPVMATETEKENFRKRRRIELESMREKRNSFPAVAGKKRFSSQFLSASQGSGTQTSSTEKSGEPKSVDPDDLLEREVGIQIPFVDLWNSSNIAQQTMLTLIFIEDAL